VKSGFNVGRQALTTAREASMFVQIKVSAVLSTDYQSERLMYLSKKFDGLQVSSNEANESKLV
jgi:hypothetical protein